MSAAAGNRWPLELFWVFPFSNTSPPFSVGVIVIDDIEFSDNLALLAGGEDIVQALLEKSIWLGV